MENGYMENSKETQKTEGFVPPRHWIGVEELQENYWKDEKIQERRAQEFFDKPVETIALIDKIDSKGMARRDFLTVMGSSMAMAGFACARRPVHKIIPYVVKPEEVTPGVSTWYASTAETGEGILIRNREGRPIKLEGNPDHPLNGGAILARTQASLLDLYDVDRMVGPVRVVAGAATETTWEKADAEVVAALQSAKASGGKVRMVSGVVLSPSTRQLIEEFGATFKSFEWLEVEPLAASTAFEANELSYGVAVNPHYRLEEAELIVSFGADFLGADLEAMHYSAAWSKRRKLQGEFKKALSKLICFESMMTTTGANADERFGVRPGDEYKLAMAVAHELIVKQGRTRFAADAAVINALKSFEPKVVAKDIGLLGGEESIVKTADLLWKSKGQSVVMAGSLQTQTANQLGLQVVVNLLNSALENEGATVDGQVRVQTQKPSSVEQIEKLIAEMKSGSVDVLLVGATANPTYFLPKDSGFAEAMASVKLVVSFADRVNETAKSATYVLPDHHYLENWGDAQVRKGVISLQQPALAPIHSTRAMQDSLLVWAKSAKLGLAETENWHVYLQNQWKKKNFSSSGAPKFETFWESCLRKGVFLPGGVSSLKVKPAARAFKVASLSKCGPFEATASDLMLSVYAKPSIGDGRQANNAWLQELPDGVTTITWDNYFNLGPALAKKMGVKTNDVIKVTTDAGTFELPAHVQPGLHPQVLTVAVGYGRTAAGKVGTAIGYNAFQLAKFNGNLWNTSGTKVSVAVKTGRSYKLAETQWHHASENRPIINDLTLTEYLTKPDSANHTDPHLRMDPVPTIFPPHEYKGHKWGMNIDLNACTGCGSCIIACMAENNIPVVGRDQVRVSREMHWIRIDRYYSGSEENPKVVFQPMLCQHCENAPCETVCPVLATVHSDEGLNEQVYNRCVGTRYCQNNCPYKTRRFNFFDHWKNYEGTLNMVWNPDVTVRTRGIMEKCTFCVQRIRDAKDSAKDRGNRVQDADLKTACQQSCPTEAIVFGDRNNPESKVAKLNVEPRVFRVLEVINTKPSISYLSKVRNIQGGHGAHESHGGEKVGGHHEG